MKNASMIAAVIAMAGMTGGGPPVEPGAGPKRPRKGNARRGTETREKQRRARQIARGLLKPTRST